MEGLVRVLYNVKTEGMSMSIKDKSWEGEIVDVRLSEWLICPVI